MNSKLVAYRKLWYSEIHIHMVNTYLSLVIKIIFDFKIALYV